MLEQQRVLQQVFFVPGKQKKVKFADKSWQRDILIQPCQSLGATIYSWKMYIGYGLVQKFSISVANQYIFRTSLGPEDYKNTSRALETIVSSSRSYFYAKLLFGLK